MNKAADDSFRSPTLVPPSQDAESPNATAKPLNESLLFHAMLSHLPDGVVITDANGRIVFINPVAQRFISYRPSGDQTGPWIDAWSPFFPDHAALPPSDDFPVASALRGLIPLETAFLVRHTEAPDGLWVSLRSRPLKDSNDAVVGTITILKDISQRKQLEHDLVEISGEEKRRIGQDLHDGVCQVLTGIKFMCNALIGKMNAKESPEAADVAEIQKLVSQALMEADTVSKGLFPVQLETDGLVSALDDLATRIGKLYHVSCRFLCDKLVFISNPDVTIHVYRIVQEALTNAVKHGHAQNIVIWLAPLGERYTLIVKDDGAGKGEQPSRRQGMGVRIMHYRAERIGASLHFELSTSGGAALTCEFADQPISRLAIRRRHDDKNSN